jgi:sugar phosphate isomerase/epimerase
MNNRLNRRQFVQLGLGALGLSMTRAPFDPASMPLLLSFSTLGCPDWSFAAVLDFAIAHSYKGIEIRGLQRQLDLTKCPEFSGPARISESRRRVAEKGLTIVDLGSSAELHYADPPIRQRQLDEGRRYIDLAESLHCPYVRVFPNRLPKGQEPGATIDLIAKGLLELADHAKGSSVSVLMETHGDLLYAADVLRIMGLAEHAHTGLVWDVYNMWSVTKEPPSEVYKKLSKYIRHTHIKDGKSVNGKEQLTLMGKGDSKVFEGVDALMNGGYKGFYSFEWEKWWHPELEDPALAIAEYPNVMKEHFRK